MNLLLDIGNSRCKFAILEKNKTREHGAIAYSSNNKTSKIEVLLQKNKVINKVIICSVLNDEFNQKLIETFSAHQINDYYFLDPVVKTFGVQLCYPDPANLGADRLAALIGANVKHKGNKCIIDCGTAITIDAIDAEGRHQGGVIIPGITAMHAALSSNTDIPQNNRGGSYNVLSNSTQDAIYTGCISAVVGGIEYAVDKMQEHRNMFDKIIITGGDAEMLIPMIALKVEHEPRLVLNGLSIIESEL